MTTCYRPAWLLAIFYSVVLLEMRNIPESNALTDNYLPWKTKHILPVIHNLENFQVPAIIDALDGIKCCTVSLRHASALTSLRDLTEQFGPYCDVGVSSAVSTAQV